MRGCVREAGTTECCCRRGRVGCRLGRLCGRVYAYAQRAAGAQKHVKRVCYGAFMAVMVQSAQWQAWWLCQHTGEYSMGGAAQEGVGLGYRGEHAERAGYRHVWFSFVRRSAKAVMSAGACAWVVHGDCHVSRDQSLPTCKFVERARNEVWCAFFFFFVATRQKSRGPVLKDRPLAICQGFVDPLGFWPGSLGLGPIPLRPEQLMTHCQSG